MTNYCSEAKSNDTYVYAYKPLTSPAYIQQVDPMVHATVSVCTVRTHHSMCHRQHPGHLARSSHPQVTIHCMGGGSPDVEVTVQGV